MASQNKYSICETSLGSRTTEKIIYARLTLTRVGYIEVAARFAQHWPCGTDRITRITNNSVSLLVIDRSGVGTHSTVGYGWLVARVYCWDVRVLKTIHAKPKCLMSLTIEYNENNGVTEQIQY